MTKESHLVHVIISSSDGYCIDTIYKDSKLKKLPLFSRCTIYLSKKDVYEWLVNLKKYSTWALKIFDPLMPTISDPVYAQE